MILKLWLVIEYFPDANNLCRVDLPRKEYMYILKKFPNIISEE